MLGRLNGVVASQILCGFTLLLGAWNFIEARRWRNEFRARPDAQFEIGKFLQGRWMSLYRETHPSTQIPSGPILVYAMSPNDCGQCLKEIEELISATASLQLEISVLMIGASESERQQVQAEWASINGNRSGTSFVSCLDCEKADFGFPSTPYRALVDLTLGVVFQEGPVRNLPGSARYLAEVMLLRFPPPKP
jgi:hypothetical protein